MVTKKITRKVITPVTEIKEEKQQQLITEDAQQPVKSKKACLFCQNKSTPSYTDLVSLRRFLTDRAKILSRQRSGICSKHQRVLAKNIKYARHLALLPFVPKV